MEKQILFVDTETKGFIPYGGSLIYVNVCAYGEQPNIIRREDLQDDILSALGDEDIIKVFHNAPFDVRHMQSNGITVTNIHDTLIASRLIFPGATATLESIAARFGKYVDKSLQQSDFTNPNKDQIRYMQQDVMTLIFIYDCLMAKLIMQNKLELFYTQCARMEMALHGH